MPFLGEGIWRKTSDDVDNFVDKGVDNKGITVENMCKRWIKQAFPKENSLLTKPEAASGKGKKHNVQRMGFSFKPLKHERNA